MLLQYRDTPFPFFLPSWLRVLPMLCVHLCSCLCECHDGTVAAQRAGWDRPVKEERQTLMNGPQQQELSSGLQQQDAIWLRSRQLPEINAIPSVPPPASLTHSLPLCWTSPVSLPISVLPFLSRSLFCLSWMCVSSLSHRNSSYLFFSASLCNPSVSISLLPPASLSLSLFSSCPVSQ